MEEALGGEVGGEERDGGRRDGDGAADNGDGRHVGHSLDLAGSRLSPLVASSKRRCVNGVTEMCVWIGIRYRVINSRDDTVLPWLKEIIS